MEGFLEVEKLALQAVFPVSTAVYYVGKFATDPTLENAIDSGISLIGVAGKVTQIIREGKTFIAVTGEGKAVVLEAEQVAELEAQVAKGELKTVQSVLSEGGNIIQTTARAEAAKGEEYLRGFLTRKEKDAMDKNPALRKMFLGQAVHRATNEALGHLYPNRFDYFTKGEDFVDTATGEVLELTTPGEILKKIRKYGDSVGILTYPSFDTCP